MAAGGGGIYSRRFGREELGKGLGEVKEVVGEAWARGIGEGGDGDGELAVAIGTAGLSGDASPAPRAGGDEVWPLLEQRSRRSVPRRRWQRPLLQCLRRGG